LPVAVFIAITPFIFLDRRQFRGDLRFEFNHYRTGHEGMEGNSILWYGKYLITKEGPIVLFSLLSCVIAIRKFERKLLPYLVVLLMYLIFVSCFAVRNERTILPMIPLIALIACVLLDRLVNKEGIWRILNILTVAFCILVPAWRSIIILNKFVATDSRETARLWIESNISRGTKIALEGYTPFVDPTRYRIVSVDRIIRHPIEWYKRNGVRFVILGEGMFGRYFLDTMRYALQVKEYRVFFSLPELKIFRDGDYEVRIYKVSW